MFIDTGNTLPRPYVFSFKDDGILIWSFNIYPLYNGTWKVKNKQLIVEFINLTLKCDITGELFTNILSSDARRIFKNLELNKVADQVLDGTTWEGHMMG